MSNEIQSLKDRIDSRLNNFLCSMKEGFDDSITGFNEAWDIVREEFNSALPNQPPTLRAAEWQPMPPERPGEFPHNGARVIVGWAATKDMSEHVELGRWRSGTGKGSGWCNTYGHSFGGVPDFYWPLPSPPKESTP